MKRLLLLIIIAISAPGYAEKIQVTAFDCGPLARGELDVVFSTGELGSGQTYFVKGKAHELCPKITKAKSISGYESNLCDNYQPENINECNAIKIFTITGYQNE